MTNYIPMRLLFERRSPGEFYQLDFEMSFVEQEDIFNEVEPILEKVFKKFKYYNLTNSN